jgi:hypothetical protein
MPRYRRGRAYVVGAGGQAVTGYYTAIDVEFRATLYDGDFEVEAIKGTVPGKMEGSDADVILGIALEKMISAIGEELFNNRVLRMIQ